MKMNELFSVGDMVFGYCNGFFDRDDYDDKVCVLVNSKYAVFQYTEGRWKGFAAVLNYTDSLSKEMVDSWKIEKTEY